MSGRPPLPRLSRPSRVSRFLLLALLAGTASAKEALELSLEAPRIRSTAPMAVRANVQWSGTRLLEGRLEIVVRSGDQVLSHFTSHDMALTSGKQTIGLLLPAIISDATSSRLDVSARFLGRRRTFAFPPVIWAAPRYGERAYVVGLCSHSGERSRVYLELARSLRLESFRPKPQRRGRPEAMVLLDLTTKLVHLTPGSLSGHPLAYCSYDVLVLFRRGFALLGQAKLRAIARWARAGGSVCVVPSDGLKARHVEFLNTLADADLPAFELAVGGTVRPTAPAPTRPGKLRVETFHPAFGRAVVLLSGPAAAEDLKGAGWRDAAAFLWKIRATARQEIADTGVWKEPPRAPYDEAALSYHVQPIATPEKIARSLMPERIRLIPFGVVILILVLFVAVVGPLDYYVLGVLRQRRFTWLTFPLAAAAFAFLTVRLAGHYMGRRDHRHALVFVDVDRKGQPVRHSRIELIFAGTERSTRHELSDCLFYPMREARLRAYDERELAMMRRVGTKIGRPEGDPSDIEALPYQGRLPTQFVASQIIRQWKPQLNRSLSFEPPGNLPTYAWNAITVHDLTPGARAGIPRELLRGRPFEGLMFIYHGRQQGNGLFYDTWLGNTRAPRRGAVRRATVPDLVRRASVRPQVGLFSVIAQLSPTGAPNFEDVAVLDPTDPDQWLLVVAEKVGDDDVICRRLYRRAPPKDKPRPRPERPKPPGPPYPTDGEEDEL